MVFHDPGTFRSASVQIMVGEPVLTADVIAAYPEHPADVVRELTARIAEAIRAGIVEAEDHYTLELLDVLERAWFQEATRPGAAEQALSWKQRVMRGPRYLAEREPHRVAALRRRVELYCAHLDEGGVPGEQLGRPYTPGLGVRYVVENLVWLGPRPPPGPCGPAPPPPPPLVSPETGSGAGRWWTRRGRSATSCLRMPAHDWRRASGVMLGALTALNGLNYLDRYVAAGTLPLILAGLAISDAQGGLLQSLFIVAYSLVCPVAGWLGDRQPRLRLAALGVFVWSAATVASGLAPTYALLLVARAVIGAGEASYSVVTPSLLSDCYPAERRARALGIFYAAIPVGSALGYILGGVVGEAYGWRATFFIAGAPGAALAFLLLLLAEPRRGALDGAASAPVSLALGDSLRSLARRRSYVVNTTAQVIYTFAMGGLATWMPTYFVRVRGIPLASAASTFGVLLVVAGFLGTLLGGRVASGVARRWPGADFVVSGWSLTVSIGFTLVAVLAPQPVVFWPAMFVTLFLLFVNIGPLNAAMANVLPAELRARGFAVTTMLMHLLGDAASPWLIGAASDVVGLEMPVLVTGCVLAVAGLVLLWGRATLVNDLKLAGEAAR